MSFFPNSNYKQCSYSQSEQFDLTCITLLNSLVDIPIRVIHTWRGPSGLVTTGSGRTISAVVGSNLQYSSTLSFSSLRSSDSGTYNCTSTVNGSSSTSNTVSSSTSFNTSNKYNYKAEEQVNNLTVSWKSRVFCSIK